MIFCRSGVQSILGRFREEARFCDDQVQVDVIVEVQL
jgi:hypothetical protein